HGYLPFCQSLSCTRTSPTEIYTLSLHDALPISRLARLEVELAVSETRRVAVDLGLASAVAMVAAIILVTGLTVTLAAALAPIFGDRKSTRLNSSHVKISYAVFCLKKKKKKNQPK